MMNTKTFVLLALLATLFACTKNTPLSIELPEPSAKPSANKEQEQEPSAEPLAEPSANKEQEQPSPDSLTIKSQSTPTIHRDRELQTLSDQKVALSNTQGDAKTQTNHPQQPVRLQPIKKDLQQTDTEATIRVAALCQAIGSKLGSVSIKNCLSQQLTHSGLSTRGQSLSYRDYLPLEGRQPLGRVLVVGGIHGDEFSSVSMMFKWMNKLNQYHSGLFHWRFIPSLNPDGLLQKKSQRQNESGVDLNRNFPTQDWNENAQNYWVNKTGKNPRRYPGENASSESETRWLVSQIDSFNPDIIISLHAPYHLVDYDGPPQPPNKLGGLYLRKLGVYPGSLGNYVGVDLNLPIVTVELKSAGIMPKPAEISLMWTDLVRWLRGQLSR